MDTVVQITLSVRNRASNEDSDESLTIVQHMQAMCPQRKELILEWDFYPGTLEVPNMNMLRSLQPVQMLVIRPANMVCMNVDECGNESTRVQYQTEWVSLLTSANWLQRSIQVDLRKWGTFAERVAVVRAFEALIQKTISRCVIGRNPITVAGLSVLLRQEGEDTEVEIYS
jgi:hypothetical protein